MLECKLRDTYEESKLYGRCKLRNTYEESKLWGEQVLVAPSRQNSGLRKHEPTHPARPLGGWQLSTLGEATPPSRPRVWERLRPSSLCGRE